MNSHLAADSGDVISIVIGAVIVGVSLLSEAVKKRRQQTRRQEQGDAPRRDNQSVEDIVEAMRRARQQAGEGHKQGHREAGGAHDEIDSGLERAGQPPVASRSPGYGRSGGGGRSGREAATSRSERARRRLEEIAHESENRAGDEFEQIRQRRNEGADELRRRHEQARAEQERLRRLQQMQHRQEQRRRAAEAAEAAQREKRRRQAAAQQRRAAQAQAAARARAERPAAEADALGGEPVTSVSGLAGDHSFHGKLPHIEERGRDAYADEIAAIEPLRPDLRDIRQLRLGIVLSEILAPPLALRE